MEGKTSTPFFLPAHINLKQQRCKGGDKEQGPQLTSLTYLGTTLKVTE